MFLGFQFLVILFLLDFLLILNSALAKISIGTQSFVIILTYSRMMSIIKINS